MGFLLIFIAHWYLSLSLQTFFLHRYASHRLYLMNQTWEKIFYILTLIFQGSSFLHPGAYAILHRNHHKYADTIKDPHSPIIINNIIDFNKKTFYEYRYFVKQFIDNKISIQDVPRWQALEILANRFIFRLFFIIFYIIIYLIYAPSAWYYLLIPIHIFMGPIHGFIVNWFGHFLGYCNFKNLKDNSKNTLPIDLLMMGELYQNNHHKYPNKKNFAYKWFEIDLGFLLAELLIKLKIIRNNNSNSTY